MKRVEITTAQNVAIQFELATLGERIIAFILDAVIVAITTLLIYGISASLVAGDMSDTTIILVVLPLPVFYHLFMEYFFNGQTLGKKIMDIRIIRVDGKPVEFLDYFTRWVLRMLEVGVIAVISVAVSKKNQRLGDMMAQTVVVKVGKKAGRMDLKQLYSLKKLDNYEAQYPEVVRLDEEEVLLIREVIIKQRTLRNTPHNKAVDELVKQLTNVLQIKPKGDKLQFLNQLVKDYVALTR